MLVDRLWPRGLSRGTVDADEWPREVAPSTGLRRFYGHEPERFSEFARRYGDELAAPPAATVLAHLRDVAAHQRLVLLTATRDVARSGAAVLRDALARREVPGRSGA